MNKLRHDGILMALILLLTLLGLVTLYSASFLFAANQPLRWESGWGPLKNNLRILLIMLGIFPIIVFIVKYEWFKNGKFIVVILAVTIIFNLLPFMSYFQKIDFDPQKDVKRWIFLFKNSRPFQFQPSELIKLTLPIYLAYILDKNRERLNTFAYGILPQFIFTMVFCALTIGQSNLSEAILVIAISLIISFAAGVSIVKLLVEFAFITTLFFILIINDKDGIWYQRVVSFFSKNSDPFNMKYQVSNSIDAIKSGGFWGKGIGQGTLKTRMPEVHGDFIFSSYAEENGLLGIIIFFFLTGAFFWLGYVTASRSNDRLKQIMVFGLVTVIAVQTLTNIAVVVGLAPTTGIPLPFVSSGGSSLLVTLIASGLILNAARSNIKSENPGGQYAG